MDIKEKWQTSFDNWLDYYREAGYDEESIELATQMAMLRFKTDMVLPCLGQMKRTIANRIH